MTQTVGGDTAEGQHRRAPSPPTARVITIVELLTRTAPDTLTLAEIVRRTGQSRATAHAVLAEMVDRGWATRLADTGTFGLGPAFVSLAQTAQQTDLLAQQIGPAVRDLAVAAGTACFAARRLHTDMITVSDHAAAPSAPPSDDTDADPARWFRLGRQIRLRPPICREFIAWAPRTRREIWIGDAPAPTRTRLRVVLDDICERGYAVERMTADHVAMIEALGSLNSMRSDVRARIGALLTELNAIDYLDTELIGDVGAVTIGAPIFGADGEVVASIVTCPNRVLPATDLRALGVTTRMAADRVTAHLGGRAPADLR
ncbi:helix-turn-helix domain-containing protein [Gordonia sp. ABSL1-1]|uniref:IclR family transcriptional regulator n=1 Tax=Gordonia sp. ABSL1-1 TaxID=3053923 RepID=UPI0025727E90|nr:helix-turn-helix domain-containing protein [Gordonia sp. ABSL1-1]MDL9936183.1 helix-turn-helix domain-containing protein [Gordonia sp. ABSL1-1]